MNAALRTIVTPRATFVLRPEQPKDERLLFDLFVHNNLGTLQAGGFPKELIDQLINFQFRSQTQTYRTMFPDAIYSIVSVDGRDIGRFIEQDQIDVVYFVDFVLFPESQSKGLGAALTFALMQEWATRGRGTRVKVMVNNEPCLKMCRRLGFTPSATDDMAYVDLRWYPPHLTPKSTSSGG